MGFITLVDQDQMSGSQVFDDTITINAGVEDPGNDAEYDLNALRSNDNRIIGDTNWYDPIPITLDATRTTLTNVELFTGMDNDADGTPTYSSIVYIANNDSLETAAGKLDAAIFTLSGLVTSERRPELIHVTITGTYIPGDFVPTPRNYTIRVADEVDMLVYYNGILLADQDNDYVETAVSGITTNKTLAESRRLTFLFFTDE